MRIFKCTIKWFLEYSERRAILFTINFKIFLSSPTAPQKTLYPLALTCLSTPSPPCLSPWEAHVYFLPLWTFYINGNTPYVVFGDGFFSLGITFTKSIHIVTHIIISSLFIAPKIILCVDISHFYLFIHQLMDFG